VSKQRRRLLLASAATLALLAPLAWFWWSSLLPGSYSVMDMGYTDYGGGPVPAGTATDDDASSHGSAHGTSHMPGHGSTSVADLRTTARGPADVSVDLVADQGTVTLPSGREIDGYTLNGSSPGPRIDAREGDLVEVTLRNGSVPEGITLHWHGIDVPNAEDGVAGVTQDAVREGEEYTYRFVADQVGTYWYHSHQVSHEQVRGGLFAPLVVLPTGGIPQDREVLAVTHTYQGIRTLNGEEDAVRFPAPAGETVRVRLVNTDNALVPVWADLPYRVVAVDGYDLNEPGPVTGQAVVLTAGGRIDLEIEVPDHAAARVQVGGATAAVVGPEDAEEPAAPPQPDENLDLLTYGEPAPLPTLGGQTNLTFDPTTAERHFKYEIGRRPGFLDGRPGLWWTVNGHLFPDIPMYTVEEGDVAVFRIENNSGESHPMHLHGHHAVVISRDGVPATGSPWWIDSLEVDHGEEFEIAFLADNPGIWMDHCHNLPHAVEGLVAHLMYAGVDTPFRIGDDAANHPE